MKSMEDKIMNKYSRYEKYNRYRQNKMIIGLLFVLFLFSPPFESNPQNCGMIAITESKKKGGIQLDDELDKSDDELDKQVQNR